LNQIEKNDRLNTAFALSAMLHLLLIFGMLIYRPAPFKMPRQMQVYQVALISKASFIPAPAAIPAEQPEIAAVVPEPEPEVVIEKPEEKPKIESDKPVEEKKVPEIPRPAKEKSPKKQTEKPESASNQIRDKTTTETKDGIEGEPIEGNQLKIDTKDFPFAYYINLLRSRISDNWRPPLARKKQPGALVGFRVLRNGKIMDVVVEKSSNNFLFDQAALRAVHFASPLPPLPAEFSEEQLSVHIEFETIQGKF
jgi:protein TonB